MSSFEVFSLLLKTNLNCHNLDKHSAFPYSWKVEYVNQDLSKTVAKRGLNSAQSFHSTLYIVLVNVNELYILIYTYINFNEKRLDETVKILYDFYSIANVL